MSTKTNKPNLQSDYIAQLLSQRFGCELSQSSVKTDDGFFWRFFTWAKNKARQAYTRELRIAVVCSHYHNSWESAAVSSTMEALQRALGDKYMVKGILFSAENSPEILHNTIAPYLLKNKGNYQACLTFASWVAVGLSKKVRKVLPVVFGGLTDLDKLGLADRKGQCINNITGVTMNVPSYEEQVRTIMQLKPELTHLIVPTDVNLTHGEYAEYSYGPSRSFVRSWRLNGGKVTHIKVSSHDDISEMVLSIADESCMVNLSLQSSIQVQARKIVQACSAQGIPVYAHSRQGVRMGAVLGSGNNGDEYGPYVAATLMNICINGQKPERMELTGVNEKAEVCYLEPELEKQGINVDQETLRTMRMLPIQHVI